MKLKDYKLVAMAFALKQWRINNDISLYRISKILNIDAHALARVENAENVHSNRINVCQTFGDIGKTTC